MSEPHFEPNQLKQIGDFCQNLIFTMKKRRDPKLDLKDVLDQATMAAYARKLTPGGPIVDVVASLEYEFLYALKSKVGPTTTWDNLIVVANELIAEQKALLQAVH